MNADTGANSGTSPAASPAPAVSADNSPTGQDIPSAPAPTTEQKPAVVIQPGIIDPMKALGLAKKPSEEIKAQREELHKKAFPNATPVPKRKKATPSAEQPAAAAKEPEKAPEVVKSAEPKVEEKPPVIPIAKEQPTKIKIGDKEMTAEEIAAKLAELEKKTEAAPVAGKVEGEKPAEKQTEKAPEITAEDKKKLDDEFLEKAAPNFTITEDELDTILSGGENAVKALAMIRAKDMLSIRKWVEETVNPILDHYDKQFTPLLENHQRVTEFQKWNGFLGENADIKGHAQGLETSKKIDAEMHAEYDRLQRLIAVNAATSQEIEQAKLYESATPEQWNSSVAHHTRERLGIKGEQPAPEKPSAEAPEVKPAATEKTPVTSPAKPRPAPPTGQIGAVGAPTKVGDQASMVQKLIAHGK